VKKLRRIRAEKGLTMDTLEERTGVSKRTISEIERGMRTPQTLTLAKLANALGVKLDDLLEEEAPKTPGPARQPDTEPAGPTDEARQGRVEGWADYVRWRASEIEREIEKLIPDPDSSQTYDGDEVYRWSSGLIQEYEAYADYRDELKPSLSGDEARMLDSALDRLWQILEAGRARDEARGGAWDRGAAELRDKQPTRPGIGGE
jgi:transcriptional regulator with XRE-family HTH domain